MAHPHAEATYRIIALEDGSFAVEVAIPGSSPTKVIGLCTQASADAWIERHKEQVATRSIWRNGNWGRRSRRR